MTWTALPRLTLSSSQCRVLVVNQYVLLLLGVTLALAFGHRNLTALLTFMLTALVGAVLHTTLAVAIDNNSQVRVETLDERQRLIRDRAFATALRGMTACLSVAWGYAMLAPLLRWWLPPADRAWFALWSLAMLAYGLPSAVAAWTRPDLEPERSSA